MVWLAIGFSLTACIYSLAGFAGGSTYLALLVVFGAPQAIIPLVALSCNTVVSAFASTRYTLAGLWRPRLLVPHMVLAIPCAYFGGRMDIAKLPFEWLTALCLLCAAVLLLIGYRRHAEDEATRPPPLSIAIPAGGILGFISGLIGIGGGIFLAPLLYFLRAGRPREIAATSSMFILVNSLAGIAGQWHKLHSLPQLGPYMLLPLAVLTGGAVGSQLTLRLLTPRQVALATGLIIFAIAARLLFGLLTETAS